MKALTPLGYVPVRQFFKLSIMRSYFNACLLAGCCFIASCSQQSSNQPYINIAATNSIIHNNQPQETNTARDLGDYANLVPIEIIDAASKNVFEKFGVEFAGNCYDCNLAAVSINKKYVDIINVCDKNNSYRLEKFTYELIANKLVVKTGKTEFVFTEIETAPVYELTIKGDSLSLKNKRLSKYYTQKKVLPKFKQHDCGDFEG